MAENKPQNNIITFLKGLSTTKKVVLLLVILGTVACMSMIMIWAGRPEFKVLYSNISSEDAGAILSRLKEKKIPYRISSDGKAILVPKEKVYELRLSLASEGLPKGGGVGFEIFDKTQLGMTEFVQNINYQRALQGELARTIDSFYEVVSSRVHIVMPVNSVFVEEEKPAKASVVIRLRPGMKLSKKEIKGIVNLVSASVPNLPSENVTVVDNHGDLLSSFIGDENSKLGEITSEQLAFQRRVEKGLEERVETMLAQALGPGKAIVRVSCSFDFTKQKETEEIFDPRKVIRSEQVLKQESGKNQNIPVGVPGVTSNLVQTDTQKAQNTVQKPTFKKEEKTVNYEISKKMRHTIAPVGKITRISVAVMVDGTYRYVKSVKSNAKNNVKNNAKNNVKSNAKSNAKDNAKKQADKGKQKKSEKDVADAGKWEYVPRSQTEMSKLENIIKRAVDFDANRGDAIEVVNMPFETTRMRMEASGKKDKGIVTSLLHNTVLIKYLLSALAIMMLFIFVVRPIIRWLVNDGTTNQPVLEQLPMTVEQIENAGNMANTEGPMLDESLVNMLTSDPDAILQLIRKEWGENSTS